MINYIVYSNTAYLEILKIQTDYMFGKGSLTLFINSNDLNLEELYGKYDNVIFYNDEDPYALRLSTCLKQINYDYFILIHDIDILISINNEKIKNIIDFSRRNNFDKIDLKFIGITTTATTINTSGDIKSWKIIDSNNNIVHDELYLMRQHDPNSCIYNVNPSIWKRNALIEIMDKFNTETYRTIEKMEVQNYCTKFKFFGLYSTTKLLCGFYNCVKDFVFLHISHSGKLLQPNEACTTVYGQSYKDVATEYNQIISKYKIK